MSAKVVSRWPSKLGGSSGTTNFRMPPRLGASACASPARDDNAISAAVVSKVSVRCRRFMRFLRSLSIAYFGIGSGARPVRQRPQACLNSASNSNAKPNRHCLRRKSKWARAGAEKQGANAAAAGRGAPVIELGRVAAPRRNARLAWPGRAGGSGQRPRGDGARARGVIRLPVTGAVSAVDPAAGSSARLEQVVRALQNCRCLGGGDLEFPTLGAVGDGFGGFLAVAVALGGGRDRHPSILALLAQAQGHLQATVGFEAGGADLAARRLIEFAHVVEFDTGNGAHNRIDVGALFQFFALRDADELVLATLAAVPLDAQRRLVGNLDGERGDFWGLDFEHGRDHPVEIGRA